MTNKGCNPHNLILLLILPININFSYKFIYQYLKIITLYFILFHILFINKLNFMNQIFNFSNYSFNNFSTSFLF